MATTSDSAGIFDFLKLVTDGYERKARLYPALLVFMPVAVLVCSGVAIDVSRAKVIGGIITACGGPLLLAQIARDSGKKKERSLFKAWGGMPSVNIFRHSDSSLDQITKARYHQSLSVLVKGTRAPTLEEEQADPSAADLNYQAWSSYLRVNTRDTRVHNLLFQENINYGYRRNVWGLKLYGIALSAMSAVGAVIWLWLRFKLTGQVSTELAGAELLSTILLALWFFRFTPSWVRVAAMAYAERLAECTESVGAKASSKR